MLRKVRLARGMTQKEVALAIGIPQSSYCLIEHGKRPADWRVVQKICGLLQVQQEEVFLPRRFAVRKINSG